MLLITYTVTQTDSDIFHVINFKLQVVRIEDKIVIIDSRGKKATDVSFPYQESKKLFLKARMSSIYRLKYREYTCVYITFTIKTILRLYHVVLVL